MISRVIDWGTIIFMPLLAVSFVVDIHNGTPASWCVWLYAFVGMLHTFIWSARSLLQETA